MYKMCRPMLGKPLEFSVTVAHRWRHFQYIVFNVSDIRLFILIRLADAFTR